MMEDAGTGVTELLVARAIQVCCQFIMGCNTSNQTKTFPTQKVGKLIPNKVPDRHWQVISIDMIGELLDSKGYNAVLVVVDHLSKWVHTVPTFTSLDSAGVA